MTHYSQYLHIKLFVYIYCVTHCSLQCHLDEQICNGKVKNKAEAEKGGTKDFMAVLGVGVRLWWMEAQVNVE